MLLRINAPYMRSTSCEKKCDASKAIVAWDVQLPVSRAAVRCVGSSFCGLIGSVSLSVLR
jgi:hypothetical protein